MNREQVIIGILMVGGAFVVPELIIEYVDLRVSAMGHDLTPYAKWGLTLAMTMLGGRNALKGIAGSKDGSPSAWGGILGRLMG